jgi:glutamate synthase (NADPH/NADH) small chain
MPKVYKVTSSHEEGSERMFNILTREFGAGKGGNRVKRLSAVRVEWEKSNNGRHNMVEVPGSEFELKADLVLLALGFLHVEQDGLVSELGFNLDPRGNIAINGSYMTSVEGVFAAGDSHRGASLVVWAIQEGREAAAAINAYLAAQ